MSERNDACDTIFANVINAQVARTRSLKVGKKANKSKETDNYFVDEVEEVVLAGGSSCDAYSLLFLSLFCLFPILKFFIFILIQMRRINGRQGCSGEFSSKRQK